MAWANAVPLASASNASPAIGAKDFIRSTLSRGVDDNISGPAIKPIAAAAQCALQPLRTMGSLLVSPHAEKSVATRVRWGNACGTRRPVGSVWSTRAQEPDRNGRTGLVADRRAVPDVARARRTWPGVLGSPMGKSAGMAACCGRNAFLAFSLRLSPRRTAMDWGSDSDWRPGNDLRMGIARLARRAAGETLAADPLQRPYFGSCGILVPSSTRRSPSIPNQCGVPAGMRNTSPG